MTSTPISSSISTPISSTPTSTSASDYVPSTDNKGILSLLSAIEQTTNENEEEAKKKHCLICNNDFNSEHQHQMINVFDEVNKSTLAAMEAIVKRKILKDKFESSFLCFNCFNLVVQYDQQCRDLEKLRLGLKDQFDLTNPAAKRGRKKKRRRKNEDEEELNETSSNSSSYSNSSSILASEMTILPDLDTVNRIRKSSRRSRKPKVLEDCFEETEEEEEIIEEEQMDNNLKERPKEEVEDVEVNDVEDKPLLFACDICGKSFALKSGLSRHRQKAHTLERPFSCDKCEKSFKQRHSLREHVLKNHDLIKKFVCAYCDDKFSSRHLLKIHERTHTGERGFICEKCGEEFATKQAMVSHKSKHNGEYQFVCEVCKKGFNSKTLFLEHSFIHSGDKPFECEQCEKKFSNRGTLWAHKKHHLSAKPYQCNFCQKCFTHSSHLAVHRRSHTGERPYKCRFCIQGFVSANHLRRHMKNHTGQLPFACQQCACAFHRKTQLIKHCQIEHNGIVVMEKGVDPLPLPQKTQTLAQFQNPQPSPATSSNYVINGQEYALVEETGEDDEKYTVVNIEGIDFHYGHEATSPSANVMEAEDEGEEVVHLSSEILEGAETTEISHMGQTVLLVHLPEEVLRQQQQ